MPAVQRLLESALQLVQVLTQHCSHSLTHVRREKAERKDVLGAILKGGAYAPPNKGDCEPYRHAVAPLQQPGHHGNDHHMTYAAFCGW